MSGAMEAPAALVIVGAGAHGRVALDVANGAAATSLSGADSGRVMFLDDTRVGEVAGVPVAGTIEWGLASLPVGATWWFIAIGNNSARRQISERVRQRGFRITSLVHRAAFVAQDVVIGRGVLVCAGVIVGTGVVIEDDCVLNTSSTIDHDGRILIGAFVAPGVTAAGGVTIGRWAFVGTGVNVAPNLSIGDGAVIGAGSLVLHDVPPGVVAFGSPARPQRSIER